MPDHYRLGVDSTTHVVNPFGESGSLNYNRIPDLKIAIFIFCDYIDLQVY